jgi:D-sedoheptulose 7-phosphate isomerase
VQPYIKAYSEKLLHAFSLPAMDQIAKLGEALREAWKSSRTVYLCGNGGSAGNAVRISRS